MSEFEVMIDGIRYYAAMFIEGTEAFNTLERLERISARLCSKDLNDGKRKELQADFDYIYKNFKGLDACKPHVDVTPDRLQKQMDVSMAHNNDYVIFYPISAWETLTKTNVGLKKLIGIKW
jgi:hypothetical protein